MIDAVTYGMIPSAKSEKRESAEPEKRFSSVRMPPPLKSCLQRRLVDARRRDPRAEPVDREHSGREEHRRLRSSGTRQALASQPNI